MKDGIRANCSVTPDVMTVGGGVDGPLFILPVNFQLGLAGNGRTGELSLVSSGGLNGGLIGPDAYVFAGWTGVAPTNQSLNSPHPANDQANTFIAGYGRVGASTDNQGNMQVTLGPSPLPATVAAASYGTSTIGPSIPYVGYLLNPPAAECTLFGVR